MDSLGSAVIRRVITSILDKASFGYFGTGKTEELLHN
jgi:hypothetical protein